jgi:hypothetical protein
MSAWPELVLWVLYLVGVFSRGPLLLYVFSVAVIFGGLSMLPPQVSGLNIPAQSTCGGFLLLAILLRADNLVVALRQAVDVRKLGLLTFFGVYVIYTSFEFPRLFQGKVLLYALNQSKTPSPLHPTSANFDQLVYMLIAIGLTFAIASASRSEIFRRHFLRSILWAASALVISGIIDLVFTFAHANVLLTPFHNATYRSLDVTSIAGVPRVTGFMPEASIFGTWSVTFLSFVTFNGGAFPPSTRRRLVPLLIFGLLVMSLMSTASTAYAGLAVMILVYLGKLFFDLVLVRISGTTPLRRLFYFVVTVLLLVALFVAVTPFLWSKVVRLLDAILFDKNLSSSYLERSRWTAAGVHAIIATYGIGVGVGSVRTSSWLVNIVASTGVLGTMLFFGFVARVSYRAATNPDPDDRRIAINVLLSLIPYAAMTCVSGTTPDPGIWPMCLLGFVYGLRLRRAAVPAMPNPARLNPEAVPLNAGT